MRFETTRKILVTNEWDEFEKLLGEVWDFMKKKLLVVDEQDEFEK